MNFRRTVLLTHVYKYGFDGRESCPTDEQIGQTGVVVRSHYESGGYTGLQSGVQDLRDLAADLLSGGNGMEDSYEVCTVVMQDGTVVELISGEFEEAK